MQHGRGPMPGVLVIAVPNSIVVGVLLNAGRWKAVTVAVKIIEHSGDSPGSASSDGKRISAAREMAVATNVSHPNIVSSTSSRHSTSELRNSLCFIRMLQWAAHATGVWQLVAVILGLTVLLIPGNCSVILRRVPGGLSTVPAGPDVPHLHNDC
jgi:hypothetical protein